MAGKRYKTQYPGVFFKEVQRIGGAGTEKAYYAVFRKGRELFEELVGYQYRDNMTPARAARYRSDRIEGRCVSRKELREAKEPEKEAWTLAKLWVAYQDAHPERKSAAQDESRWKTWLEEPFGDRESKNLVALDVDRLRLSMAKNKGAGTVRNVLELLRRVVSFGVKKNLCEGPKFKITLPKGGEEKTEDLTEEELARLLIVLNDPKTDIQAGNMMRLALLTGMRRGELFRLEWRDIDYERGFISLRNPKGGTDQKVPLNEAARKLLEEHPEKEGCPYVFPGRKGRQRVEARKALNDIKARANLPKDFRPLHGLRHAFASSLASEGVDLYTLQKLLTHKSPAMTQRYAHLRDAVLRKASDLAAALLDKPLIEAKKEVSITDTKE